MDLDQIILEIKDLPLSAILFYLASKGIDFVQEECGKLKKIVVDKQNEKKYLFVPIREEALKLKRLSGHPKYKELELLVPNYKYLDLIRTGLLIDDYGRNFSKENDDRIKQIKFDIIKNPRGKRLLKIVNLPSTIFFSSIVRYLHKLKVNNYPENHIQEEFEEFVDDWRESSLFVEKTDEVDKIKIFCHKQKERDNDRFFILATKDRAISIVEESLKDLKKENFFFENFYKYDVFKDGGEKSHRIEVIISRKDTLPRHLRFNSGNLSF